MTAEEKHKVRQMQGIALASVLLILILLGITIFREKKRRAEQQPIEELVSVDAKVYQSVISDLQKTIADKQALIASWDDGRDTIRLRGRDIIKTVYVDTSDAVRTLLLWYNKEMDDSLVELPLQKLINYRLAQAYLSRGELKICDIQLSTCRTAMDDYKSVVYYDSVYIKTIEAGLIENTQAYNQCRAMADKINADLKKETKSKNIWRVSALVAGSIAALFIVK